jgi:hypothetical protein
VPRPDISDLLAFFAVATEHANAAEFEGRNLKAALAENALLHCRSPDDCGREPDRSSLTFSIDLKSLSDTSATQAV